MRRTNTERIDALRSRRAQIDAELLRLEAKAKAEDRKSDTRRKILIGAVVMQEMERRNDFAAWIKRLLGQRLTRPRDRALFGMGPIPSS